MWYVGSSKMRWVNIEKKKILILVAVVIIGIVVGINVNKYPTIKGVEICDDISSWESGPYTFIQGNIENTTNHNVEDYAVIVEDDRLIRVRW